MFIFSGEKLREERERKRLSREQLALTSGLSASSITAFETGWRRPSRAALLRMATALGVSPRNLVDPDPAFSAVAR
jgi:transcriptional regulator with XRE-family HTH domain